MGDISYIIHLEVYNLYPSFSLSLSLHIYPTTQGLHFALYIVYPICPLSLAGMSAGLHIYTHYANGSMHILCYIWWEYWINASYRTYPIIHLLLGTM